MLVDIKQKFDAILAREKTIARSVAAAVIRSKPLSVWEVLIPVIFILMFMKVRQEREVFSQNLMFTKKMSLEAAYKMVRNQQPLEAVLTPIEQQTRELVTSAPEGIYSEQIRREQLKEIRILIAHYCRLLNAEGADVNSLITGAYPNAAAYESFLRQLSDAEAQVSAAARRTLGSRADTRTLARIETALSGIRRKEVEEIFASG